MMRQVRCLVAVAVLTLTAGQPSQAARNGSIRGRVDLRRVAAAAGRSKSIRFDRPGIVRVFCDIHSHMNAFILVFNHPFFSVTDADGRYRIDNIPPGTYNVVAWNEGLASEPRVASVPDGGSTEL